MSTRQLIDGKEAKVIFWPDGAGEVGRELRACKESGVKLVYREQYLGDHSECWFCVMDGEREIARHNTKFIESIVWVE